MPTGAHLGRVQIVAAIDTDSVVKNTSYTKPSKPRIALAMPDATSGTLTTRTNDTQGVITSEGHGLTDADTIAVFWDGGYCYDAEITSYTEDTITFTAASGDALPALGTGDPPAVTIAVAQDVTDNVSLDGNTVDLMIVKVVAIAERGLVVLYDDEDTELWNSDAVHSTLPFIWPQTDDEAETQPFTDIAVWARFYNGSTSAGEIVLVAVA